MNIGDIIQRLIAANVSASFKTNIRGQIGNLMAETPILNSEIKVDRGGEFYTCCNRTEVEIRAQLSKYTDKVFRAQPTNCHSKSVGQSFASRLVVYLGARNLLPRQPEDYSLRPYDNCI